MTQEGFILFVGIMTGVLALEAHIAKRHNLYQAVVKIPAGFCWAFLLGSFVMGLV